MNLYRKIIPPIIALIIVSSLLIAEDETMIGLEAPRVMLFKYDEDIYFKSKDYIDKKYLIYSFWATWCGPCMKEMPHLYKIMEDLDPKKYELLLINVQEERKDIREKFLSKFDNKHTILLDVYGMTYEKFSGTEEKSDLTLTLPLTVIVDKKGKIIYHHTGYTSGDEKKLKAFLDDLK